MSSEEASKKTIERLKTVRHALLRLHKMLLEFQRQEYEREGGRVSNSYQLLNLVMHNESFAWLHQLSELVVQIDEILDAEEELREADLVALLDQARFLVLPSETGDEFQRRYFDSLQQSPDVVLAHSEVVRLLGKKSSEVH